MGGKEEGLQAVVLLGHQKAVVVPWAGTKHTPRDVGPVR